MYVWTDKETEKILIQLERYRLPFGKYRFSRKEEDGLHLLGKGGFASVYEAESRWMHKKYAVKVIGFGNKGLKSGEFVKNAKIQSELGIFQKHIVKVYDYIELWIKLDEDNQVLKIIKTEPEENASNYLKLQFVLMEKLVPVWKQALAEDELIPKFEREEVLNLAFDIGKALQYAHDRNVLHRDVKLENIFYSSKDRAYKLGDFGVSKVTRQGIAETAAFTKGYGAPEITEGNGEFYDNTADIYSFGMVLYYLLNGSNFPEIYRIIEKMIAYNPDDRYQSMEEILSEIDRLLFNEKVHGKRKDRNKGLAWGKVLLIVGSVIALLTFKPDMELNSSISMYIFIGLAAVKYILNKQNRNIFAISYILLGLGSYLLITAKISLLKGLLLFGIAFGSGNFAGIVSAVLLALHYTAGLMQNNREITAGMENYRWLSVLLLSFAVALLFYHMVLETDDRETIKMYLVNHNYWLWVSLLYAVHIPYGYMLQNGNFYFSGMDGMKNVINALNCLELVKVGVGGVILSFIWLMGEQINHLKSDEVRRKGKTAL